MNEKTSQFIDSLSKEVKPVKRLASPGYRLASWLVAVILCLGAGVSMMGISSDVPKIFQSPLYVVEIIVTVALGLLAALSAFILSVPGRATSRTRWLAALPITAWVAILVYRVVRSLVTGSPHDLVFDMGFMCSRDLLLLGLAPGVLLFLMVRNAAPLKIGLVGALIAVSMAAFGASALQFLCTRGSTMHIMLWHLGPILLLGFAGVALGKWLLRWNRNPEKS